MYDEKFWPRRYSWWKALPHNQPCVESKEQPTFRHTSPTVSFRADPMNPRVMRDPNAERKRVTQNTCSFIVVFHLFFYFSQSTKLDLYPIDYSPRNNVLVKFFVISNLDVNEEFSYIFVDIEATEICNFLSFSSDPISVNLLRFFPHLHITPAPFSTRASSTSKRTRRFSESCRIGIFLNWAKKIWKYTCRISLPFFSLRMIALSVRIASNL